MDTKKVVLISCSKAKRSVPCAARLLYDASNLFRKSLAYAQTISNEIYVISSKHGLLPLDQVIAPYDDTLNDKSRDEIATWGQRVTEQIRFQHDILNTEFVILAGKNYYSPLQAHLPNISLPLQGLSMGARLARLESLLVVDYPNQRTLCGRLHELFNAMPRYRWNMIENIRFNSGIYILFEEGEKYQSLDRIVRVGTHRSDGRLKGRLKDHFLRENKDGSIFRKNIGRAILNKNNHPYLTAWNMNTSKRDIVMQMGNHYDPVFQKKLERQISGYFCRHFSFACFPVATTVERLRLEEGIIATLHSSPDFYASPEWRGRQSPELEIAQSGMWLKEGLNGTPLSENEYVRIKQYCSDVEAVLIKTEKGMLPVKNSLPANVNPQEDGAADTLWQQIIYTLSQSPREIQLLKQNGEKGKWISVYADNKNILIGRARHNRPSSEITKSRAINKNEFTELYPLFFCWKNKNITRQEAKGSSMNSSYVFALISEFGVSKEKE
jgi:hypothetical protein